MVMRNIHGVLLYHNESSAHTNSGKAFRPSDEIEHLLRQPIRGFPAYLAFVELEGVEREFAKAFEEVAVL